jgi:hypothetical protein
MDQIRGHQDQGAAIQFALKRANQHPYRRSKGYRIRAGNSHGITFPGPAAGKTLIVPIAEEYGVIRKSGYRG